jgi:hypothetical protein
MFSIRFGRWLRALALLGAVFVASHATAVEKLGSGDKRAIEATIRQQLDAFGRDDAERAFGLATPDIRRLFRTPDHFLQVVRDRYEPVYRAASVRFVRLEVLDDQWVQTVRITDGEGRVWRALFAMRRQADKVWKVGGCQLLETQAVET